MTHSGYGALGNPLPRGLVTRAIGLDDYVMEIDGRRVGWVWAGKSCVASSHWVASSDWSAGVAPYRIFSSPLDALDWMVSVLLEEG